jgi:hypothetical protein
MAMTLVCAHLAQANGQVHLRLFLSNSYSPTKDRNPDGSFRADQEWQHPDAKILRYNDLGALEIALNHDRTLQVILTLGATQMGGHLRVIDATDTSLVDDRLQTWEEREEYDRAEQEAAYQAHIEEELKRQPVFEFCPTCGRRTESCKHPEHRGRNRCMVCGGGIGNRKEHYCVNCFDIPWRKKREAALGVAITYLSEESD